MATDFKKISNPLTIIAIFAGLAEINGTVVLGLVPTDLQGIFIWFIIIFPSVLVLIFFFTLNFNPKVLYAPSDFSNEENFLKTLGKSAVKFEPVKIDVTKENYKTVQNFSDIVRKAEGKNFNKDPFLPETQRHLNIANTFWDLLYKKLDIKIEKGIILHLSYGIQAPEYFIITYSVPSEILKQVGGIKFSESIILRVTENEKKEINLIAIGKDIIEKDPKEFSEKVYHYINNKLNQIVDFEKVRK
jgi:hypothetical protein